MSENAANVPVSINADRGAGMLSIAWADGHRSDYGAERLRLLCPCAFCRGEAGRPGWLDTNPTLTPEQSQIVGAKLVGQYAIAMTWADGHDTGYYTYASLRDGCPCPVCSSERARMG